MTDKSEPQGSQSGRWPNAAHVVDRLASAFVPDMKLSVFQELAVALACLVAGTLLRLLFALFVPESLPFATFFPMVMVATLIAGWRSGVMVAVAGGPLALWLTFGGPDRNQVGELAAWALMSSLVVLTGSFVRAVVISLRTRTGQLAQSERHQALLARELNHRVKNTLALVQAIARHTLKNATEPSAMKAYSDRLFALAAAHDLLLQSKWESAELREIATRVLSAHPADRWTLEGCDLPLRPRAAVYVSMGLHELTTNASKYGALSVPHGRVMLTWTIVHNSPARLQVRWQERNGPEVQPPRRKGFGTTMLERVLAGELGGNVRLLYEPHGLTCEIDAPWPLVEA